MHSPHPDTGAFGVRGADGYGGSSTHHAHYVPRSSAAVALLGILAMAAPAAAERLRAPACDAPPARATKPASVRDVDWCNRDDLGVWGSGGLRDGRSTVHLYRDISQPHDTIAASLRGVVVGDLDGDRRPEAVVVLEKTTWIGRTGRSTGGTIAYVYGFAKGAPVRLGAIATGTPVEAITLAKRVVTITSGPATARSTRSYRRVKADFVEITRAP
jgi:hypothetical protein